jgi:hypothetical protein
MITGKQLSLFKGKRQRGVAPPPPLEFHLACAVSVTLSRWISPGWIFNHIPLGELRPKEAGRRLKRMGTRPGWPDIIIFAPQGRGPFFLELKRRGGRLTAEQEEFQRWAQSNGYPFEVANSFDGALAILQRWGAVRTGITISA